MQTFPLAELDKTLRYDQALMKFSISCDEELLLDIVAVDGLRKNFFSLA